MDFGTWSPSHTIFVFIMLVGFIGQVAVYFYKTSQNDKRIERLEERMDKRFGEVIAIMNHQIGEVRTEIGGVRADMNQQISDFRSEMNQQGSDLRGEIRDLRLEMSKLNQNHIDHLTHHHES